MQLTILTSSGRSLDVCDDGFVFSVVVARKRIDEALVDEVRLPDGIFGEEKQVEGEAMEDISSAMVAATKDRFRCCLRGTIIWT